MTTDRPVSGRGPSLPVVLVVGALAAEATAMLALALDGAVRLGSGALGTGAQVMLVAAYAVVGLGLAAAAVGIARGRAAARGAAVAAQLFAVLLSSWLVSIGAGLWGAVLLVVAGAALVSLFTRPLVRHLGGPGSE